MSLRNLLASLGVAVLVFSVHADEPITNVMSAIVSYQHPEDFSCDVLTNGGVMSAIVSYQYTEDFSSAVLTNGGLMSPIVSYQYLEWPGNDVLGLLSSRMVSYYYAYGTEPPLTVTETNRTATTNEIGAPVFASIPAMATQLVTFVNGTFVTNAPPLDQSRMTIVLTHGWNSDPVAWAQGMAVAIQSQIGTGAANIVAWDWRVAAQSSLCTPDEVGRKTPNQGTALGQALYGRLGTDYSQPIHFVGHSFGALVNAFAADYLDGPLVKASGAYLPANTHLTLFDEAEMGTAANCLSVAWKGVAGITPDPVYAHPLPRRFGWADNYITAFGLLHSNAANVVLLNHFPTSRNWLSLGLELSDYHSYPQEWYRDSVANPGGSPMGFGRSFEMDGLSPIPATGTVHVQVGTGLNLIETNFAGAKAMFDARFQQSYGRPQTVASVLTNNIITVNGWAVGYNVLGDAASNAWNVIYNFQPVGGNTPQMQKSVARALTGLDGSGEVMNVAGYAWISLSVPADAVAMAFDFKLQGNGDTNTFAAALNGTNVLSIPVTLIPTNELVNSGMIDVSGLAGQTAELFLGVIGDTATNIQLTVQDIYFYKISPPEAGFEAMPAAGVAPLAVTFTDNSIGAITNWSWSFGDGAMTNETDGNVSHSYSTPGTNTVTLIVSGPTGTSTNTMLNLIWALNEYQGWQFQYFGCVDCPQAADDADPDGDGMSNLQEHAAGTMPTNATSTFKVGESARTADGFTIIWQSVPGKTYKVLYADLPGGPWQEDLPPDSQLTAGTGETTLSYTDETVGAATKRFYRVKLVVP